MDSFNRAEIEWNKISLRRDNNEIIIKINRFSTGEGLLCKMALFRDEFAQIFDEIVMTLIIIISVFHADYGEWVILP